VSLVELKADPTKSELKWFGVLLLAFCGFIGLLVWRATDTLTASRYVWAAGVLLAAIYYAVPPVRRPMFVAWMYAAYPMGWVVSHVLLAVVFFGVLTPIGLAMRLFREDPMHRRLDRAARSYWVERRPAADVSRYFRQF
jgi:protein-S-isoprenylcysteine O-methyltransferase Ste14